MQLKECQDVLKLSFLGFNEFIPKISRGAVVNSKQWSRMEEMVEDLFQVFKRESFEYYIWKTRTFDSLPRETLQWIIKHIICCHLETKLVII